MSPDFYNYHILFRYPLRLRFYSVRLFFQLSHSHMQWPTHSSDKSCPNHFMTPSQAEIRISLDIYPLRTVTRTARIELMTFALKWLCDVWRLNPNNRILSVSITFPFDCSSRVTAPQRMFCLQVVHGKWNSTTAPIISIFKGNYWS